MKVTPDTPNTADLLIAFNGELIGFVIEADDEAGYVIQYGLCEPVEEVDGFPCPIGPRRREGKVAFLGHTDTDDRDMIRERLNRHRKDCGLPPYGES